MFYMMGVIPSFHGTVSVIMAVVTTAVVCFTVLIFIQAKYDFTFFYAVLFISVIVWILIRNLNLQNDILKIVCAGLGVLLLGGFLAVDIQRLLGNEELALSPEEYVFTVLKLCMDIISIFICILAMIRRARGRAAEPVVHFIGF